MGRFAEAATRVTEKDGADDGRVRRKRDYATLIRGIRLNTVGNFGETKEDFIRIVRNH